jgi:hypothetical protein
MCRMLQNSANLALLSPLYRSSPKEIPVSEAIVLSSLPPVCNVGRRGVNSIIVCSAECTRERNIKACACGISGSVFALSIAAYGAVR